MTWDLSETHIEFRGICRSFVDRHVRPVVDESELAGRPPSALMESMGAAGLLGLRIPEEFGGSGGDALSIVLLAEELSRASGGIAITALVSSYMAAPYIQHFGSADQRRRWLPGVCAGSNLVAIAITEPDRGSDVAGISAVATRDGDGYRIQGNKMFITNAGLSDVIVVAAKTDPSLGRRGITLFLVESDAPGLSMSSPLRKLGWHASDTRELAFEGCWVPEGAILGEVGRGFYYIMETFELERVLLAAMGLGHAAECLENAAAYLAGRIAFGTRLSDLQTIRHRLAGMTAELEAAKALTYQSAARIDADHPDAGRSAAMAKYWVARAANRIVDDAVQLFGGAGFLEEVAVARHYRDVRVLRIGGGTDEIQLEILSKRGAVL